MEWSNKLSNPASCLVEWYNKLADGMFDRMIQQAVW